jgi:PKD repeat protein
MFRFFTLLISIGFAWSLPAQMQVFQGEELEGISSPALRKEFYDYKVFELDVALLNRHVRSGAGEVEFQLHLGAAYVWNIRLAPRDIRSENYRVAVASEDGTRTLPKGENKTFRGALPAKDGGEVRLTLDEEIIFGYVETGGERFFIEPLCYYTAGAPAGQIVVYRESDVNRELGGTCALLRAEGFQEEHLHAPSKPGAEKSAGQCYTVDIALAADFQLANNFGGAAGAEAFMIGVLNTVQDNYDDEFSDEINYSVVTQFISTCASCDPWTTSNDGETLLNSFTNWGNNGGFGVNFSVATLWTNRDLSGTTIGIAWLGGLCSNLKYNVCQNFTTNASFLRVLQSHELGHNFNANHDADGAPFIMAPSVSSSTNWSSNSTQVINNFISVMANEPGCFSGCAPPAPPVASIVAPATNICPGSIIPFIDNSSNNPTSWNWQFPGGNPSSSNLQNPTVRYDFPGSYPVTLTVTNSSGTDATALNGSINVSDNGIKYLMYETFEGGPVFWEISNPDNNTTWELTSVGGTQYGKKAMYVNNFNYNAPGQVDALVSQPLNFAGQGEINLQLDYAYRRFNNSTRDRLRIKVSVNNGVTYPFTLFDEVETGGGNFATASDSQLPFFPSSQSEWCYGTTFGPGCISIDLSQFSGQTQVRIRIENVNDHGNNMFVDNIRITSSCQQLQPPVAAFSSTAHVGCAPLTVTFQDQSQGTVTDRQWNFPGGAPPSSVSPDPVVVYPTAGVYDVSLFVSNSAGSSLAEEVAYVVVNSAPQANFVFDVQGSSVYFDNLSQDAQSYLWNFGDGSTSTQVNPTHQYLAEGQYVVTLTAFNDCGQVSIQEDVVISSPLSVAFSAAPEQGCAPLVVAFSDESVGDVTNRQWTFEGGTPATSTAQNPVVTYSQPGTYNVTLTVSNGLSQNSAQETDMIAVGGAPVSGFGASNPTGSPTVTFSNTSQDADTYQWFFGDGSQSVEADPEHTYADDGIYSVLLIANNACGSDTLIQEVEILLAPSAAFSASATTGCGPLTVQFSSESTGSGLSYSWIFPGGSPASSTDPDPVVVYSQPGVFDVTLTAANAAGQSMAEETGYVTVQAGPVSGFEISNPAGSPVVTFTNTSQEADAYQWFFGDGAQSAEADPEHSYIGDGIYTVMLIANNACGSDTAIQEVEILLAPSAAFSASATTGCGPLTVQFSSESTGSGLSYAWVFPGGSPASSTDPDPVVVYSQPGVYDVTLTVANAAGQSMAEETGYVTVQAGPVSGFEISNPAGSPMVTFTNTSQEADAYQWFFGDGAQSAEADPEHSYAGDGIYTVLLIANNACGSDTAIQEVEILLAPSAAFSSSATAGCGPLTVQFSSESTGSGLSYAWAFPGGSPAASTDPDPAVVYSQPGVYDVTLTVANAAGQSIAEETGYMTVQGGPVSGFEISNPAGSPMVTFTNTSQDADAYQWFFGDGAQSAETNPTHTYAEEGLYTVTLVAANACGSDTSVQDVAILLPPSAAFSASEVEGCPSLEVQFFGQPEGTGISYSWTFEGGQPGASSQQNPVVSYSAPGQYSVQLIVGNAAGQDTVMEESFITILEGPGASFESSANGYQVQFYNNSSGAVSYLWDFGDGATSEEENPVHHYNSEGVFIISLTAINDCGSHTTVDSVVIDSALPFVAFSMGGGEGCAPLSVQFFSEAENADSVQWFFPGGTPTSSSDVAPVVVYSQSGTYNVTLIAYNPSGSAALTTMQAVSVKSTPLAGFDWTIDEATAAFHNTSQNATQVEWNFGDGTTSLEFSPQHTFPGPGFFVVTLIAVNECGSDTLSREVVIEGVAPSPGFDLDEIQGCAPASFSFTDQSEGNPTFWQWEFPGGDPESSNEQNPVVLYDEPGIYSVVLTVTNAFGSQSQSWSDFLTVLAAPEASFDFEINGLEISFEATATGENLSYEWHFGDGSTSDEISPAHQYGSPGVYNVALIATNECGADTVVKEIDLILDGVGLAGLPVELKFFPNPNGGQFTLQLQGSPAEEISLRLLNALAQEVFRSREDFRAGSLIRQFDLDLPAGAYLLQIGRGGRFVFQKVIVR